jgi:S-adenosylmethionine hydrolase
MKPILVFQTDFTYKEGAVAAMYGVVKSVDRELEVIDATHEIPQYDIWSASYRLSQYMQFWPEGTIFISVVDPGVGTNRRACVALTNSGYFVVTPDNGTLTHVMEQSGVSEIREIDEQVNRLHGKGTEETSVFHGRDLFSYTAARLASGIIDHPGVGPKYPVKEIVQLPIHKPEFRKGLVRGIFEIGDPNFGNLWTNIPLADFQSAGFRYGDKVKFSVTHAGTIVYKEVLPFHQTFGEIKPGEPLLYNNELNRVSVAINQGSFMEKYHLGYGPDWLVEIAPA